MLKPVGKSASTYGMNMLVERPRLPQWSVTQAMTNLAGIRPLARLESLTLTTACRQAGLPLELAEVCAGLLASVFDDLMVVGRLPKTDIERSKRLERVLSACHEPASHALKIAIACSPINGKAAVRHWDAICDKSEVGKMAWLLGMQTDNAYKYSKKIEKRG